MRRYIPQRHTYLSEFENGVEVPARRSILRIAEALETDGDELSDELS